MSKPTLLVDFDGVIHSYSSGWQGAAVIPDPPVPGALPWLARATEHWTIAVYSARSADPAGAAAMREYVARHAALELGFEHPMAFASGSPVQFPDHKPAALLTIDDRCVCFRGDWSALDPRELLDFRPWNRPALTTADGTKP